MVAPKPKRRWFSPTPGWLILALLPVEGLLFLAERFRWFPKGWPVLIAIAAVAAAMLLMFLWFAVALIFRRRVQFSIRSLLVLVVVVAVPCSWLAVEMRAARRQKAAVEEIVVAGGFVWYDYQLDSLGGLVPNPRQSGPQWLRNLFGNHFFDTATAACIEDDKALSHLTQLPQLQELHLNSQPPPIFIFDYKRQIDVQLRVPKLGRSRFEKLSAVPPRLDYKNLIGGVLAIPADEGKMWGILHFSDAALANLKSLSRLKVLSLEGTAIGDDGLKHIQGLMQLRELYLYKSRVTDDGVKGFQQALPNCEIDR